PGFAGTRSTKGGTCVIWALAATRRRRRNDVLARRTEAVRLVRRPRPERDSRILRPARVPNPAPDGAPRRDERGRRGIPRLRLPDAVGVSRDRGRDGERDRDGPPQERLLQRERRDRVSAHAG